jgi:hypothetical protein
MFDLTNTQIIAALQNRALPMSARAIIAAAAPSISVSPAAITVGAPGALLALCIPSLGAIRSSHQTRALPRDDG